MVECVVSATVLQEMNSQIHFLEESLWPVHCEAVFPNGTAFVLTVRFIDGLVIFVGPDYLRTRTIAGLCWV